MYFITFMASPKNPTELRPIFRRDVWAEISGWRYIISGGSDITLKRESYQSGVVCHLPQVQVRMVGEILLELLLVPTRAVVGVVAVVEEELLPLADVPDGEDTGDGAVSGMVEEPLRAVVVEAMVHLVSLHQE